MLLSNDTCWKNIVPFLDEEGLGAFETFLLPNNRIIQRQWDFLDQRHRRNNPGNNNKSSKFGSTARDRGLRFAICTRHAKELESERDNDKEQKKKKTVVATAANGCDGGTPVTTTLNKKRKRVTSTTTAAVKSLLDNSQGYYTKADLLRDFGDFMEQDEESRNSPDGMEFFVRLTYHKEEKKGDDDDAGGKGGVIILYEGFVSQFALEDDTHHPVDNCLDVHEVGVITLFLGRHENILGPKSRTGIKNDMDPLDCTIPCDRLDVNQSWPESARQHFLSRISLTLMVCTSSSIGEPTFAAVQQAPPFKLVVTTRGYQGSRGWMTYLNPMIIPANQDLDTAREPGENCSGGGGGDSDDDEEADDDDDDDSDDRIVRVGFHLWQKHSFAIRIKWGDD